MAWVLGASPRWWAVWAAGENFSAAVRALHWRLLAWSEPRVVTGPVSPSRLAAAGLLVPALVALGIVVQGISAAPAVVRQYLAFDRQSQAIEIVDARERWLGIVPAAMEPRVAGEMAGWPEHRALAVAAVPQGWLDVLVALEDRHAGRWRSGCGIDAVAIGRAAVLGLIGHSGRGGSTLAMQLVRSMRHLAPGADGSTLARLKRKMLEIRHGAMLACALGGIRDPRFQRLLARHLPLVQGTPESRMGGALYGLGMAAQVLFGKRIGELDLAEQAVLAAAVRRHVLLAPDDDADGIALRDDRWGAVKRRARLGLRLAYGDEGEGGAAAMERLAAMPAPRAMLADEIARAVEGGPAERFRLAANPEYRTAALLRGEVVTALGELWNRFAADYRGKVTGITLSVDAADNLAFKRRVEDALAVTEAQLGERLNLPLLARSEAGDVAQVVLIEADAAGRIRRHYLNSAEPVSLGLSWRQGGDGEMRLAASDRHVGSVAKAALAVLLGAEDQTTARYCNQRTADGRVHNWDGDAGVASCDAAKDSVSAWHTVGDVFGRSLNLPLLWRLRSVPERDLMALADRAGLRLDPGAPPGTAMVLGLASVSPAQLAAMMQAIGKGALRRPAVGRHLRIVAGYRVLGDDGEARPVAVPAESALDLAPYFAAGGTAGFVRHVLAAPLKSGGTLSAVAAGHGGGLHLAKTGTTTVDGGIRDKWVIGVRETAGDVLSYALLIGTADPARPLGQRISGNDLAEVLRALWR